VRRTTQYSYTKSGIAATIGDELLRTVRNTRSSFEGRASGEGKVAIQATVLWFQENSNELAGAKFGKAGVDGQRAQAQAAEKHLVKEPEGATRATNILHPQQPVK
jgi:hypothetical protein